MDDAADTCVIKALPLHHFHEVSALRCGMDMVVKRIVQCNQFIGRGSLRRGTHLIDNSLNCPNFVLATRFAVNLSIIPSSASLAGMFPSHSLRRNE